MDAGPLRRELTLVGFDLHEVVHRSCKQPIHFIEPPVEPDNALRPRGLNALSVPSIGYLPKGVRVWQKQSER